MQYKYITCQLPSNGLLYETKEVHLRPKTIFDIKTLLGNPAFLLKSEIDALQCCIDPSDNIDVYDLVNQDVVYLLYKLRSLSDDIIYIKINNNEYSFNISDLDVKLLTDWEPEITLPESGKKVVITYEPIKNVFNIEQQQSEFKNKYPEYRSDIATTLHILNSVVMVDNVTNKDHIRNILESLSWKDSLFLINKIDELQATQFGVIEEVTIEDEDGNKKTIPIQITEEFFRPTL